MRLRRALKPGLVTLPYLYPVAAYFLVYLPFLVPHMRSGGELFPAGVALASGYLLSLLAFGSVATMREVALHSIGMTASALTTTLALTYFHMPAFGNVGNWTFAEYLANPSWLILCGVVFVVLLLGRLIGQLALVIKARLVHARPEPHD